MPRPATIVPHTLEHIHGAVLALDSMVQNEMADLVKRRVERSILVGGSITTPWQ